MSNSTIDDMTRHRSIRAYEDVELSDTDVRTAVTAAQCAATSGNVQAYCLVRVRDTDVRAQLVGLTGGQQRVADAGGFFIVCGDSRRHRLILDDSNQTYEGRLEAFMVATIDATLFAQNLILAFESLGYGTCCIGGLRNDLPAVQELITFPDGVYPLFGLCVGTPDEDPMPRPRLPFEAVCFDDQYPDDAHMRGMMAAYDDTMRSYHVQRDGKETDWSSKMAGIHGSPRREDLASYYLGQGARLD